MRYCPNCGTPINENSKFCENCGAKLSESEQKANVVENNPVQKFNQLSDTIVSGSQSKPIRAKHSGLGITAFILSLTFILAPVAVLLAIIDLIKNKQKKHGLSIAALIIGGIIIFIMIMAATAGSKNSTVSTTNTASYDSGKDSNVSEKKNPSSKKSETTKTTEQSKDEYVNSCVAVSYDDVARDPDSFNGKLVKIEGFVVQVTEGVLNSVTLRVATSANGYDDIFLVSYTRSSDEKRILEQDKITVYGKCTGVQSYTSVLGAKITIPAISAKYIDISQLTAPQYSMNILRFDIAKETYGENYEYDAIVEIKNTGTSNIYIKDAKFEIEDASGHLIQSDEYSVNNCPDVIKPGEKGYIYTAHTNDIEGVDSPDGLVLKPRFTVISTHADPVEYEVSDTSLIDTTYGIKVTGRVANSTDKDQSFLPVNVIYFDVDGNVLGICNTYVSELSAGETDSFEVSGIFMINEFYVKDVADYLVIARDNYYGN